MLPHFQPTGIPGRLTRGDGMDRQEADQPSSLDQISRRSLIRGVGAGALAVSAGGLLAACSSKIKGSSSGSGGKTKGITIGWIHPLTGPLAGFGAPDNWVIGKIKATTPYKNGFKIGGKV